MRIILYKPLLEGTYLFATHDELFRCRNGQGQLQTVAGIETGIEDKLALYDALAVDAEKRCVGQLGSNVI